MKFQKNAALVFCFWLIAIFAWWENAPLSAADLPQATQKLIADSKLDPSILDGLDRELAVPRAWLDGARGEGTVRLSSTLSPNEVKNLLTPFQERYPFIKVAYSRGTAQQREMGMIVAFKEGRYLSDVISSYSGAYSLFVEANALDCQRRRDSRPAWRSKSRPEAGWDADMTRGPFGPLVISAARTC